MSVPSDDGRIRVRHREFLGDVKNLVATPEFEVVANLPINPGMVSTFPWLSGIAQLYESYSFRSLQFEYLPSCSTNTDGVVLLAIDYDAGDPAPPTKSTLMQMHGAVRTSLWNACCLTADPADLHKLPQRYTRKTVWGGAGDIKTYDVGNLYIASSNHTGATTAYGELYVNYDVELITPQPWINSTYIDSAKLVGAGTVTTGKPYGTAGTVSANSSVGTYDGTTGSFNFSQLGEFLLSATVPCTNPLTGSGLGLGQNENVEVTMVGTPLAPTGSASLAQQFIAKVHALPASITPALQGPTAPLAGGFMRFAPYLASLL
jgi:hypothetical protein